MPTNAQNRAMFGAILIVIYTLSVTLADTFTKHLATTFDAPQVLVLCSATILLVILGMSKTGKTKLSLRTKCPKVMALRSLMAVVAAVLFYYAFALLPFADVFLFIAMVPIFAALMSGLILKEAVSIFAWLAVVAGSFGVFLLFPEGLRSVELGHIVALGAALSGTLAIVLARYVARVEQNPMALVFYPQLAIFALMICIAPSTWVAMSLADVAMCVGCGLILFVARYALALAMQALPAHAATPLLNLQFVWMVLIGMVFFGEYPQANTLAGAAIIILSGLSIVYQQTHEKAVAKKAARAVSRRPYVGYPSMPRTSGDSEILAPASR